MQKRKQDITEQENAEVENDRRCLEKKKATSRIRINTDAMKHIGVAMRERNLLAVSTNVCDMGNGDTRRIIPDRIKGVEIDISTIQETHRIIDG